MRQIENYIDPKWKSDLQVLGVAAPLVGPVRNLLLNATVVEGGGQCLVTAVGNAGLLRPMAMLMGGKSDCWCGRMFLWDIRQKQGIEVPIVVPTREMITEIQSRMDQFLRRFEMCPWMDWGKNIGPLAQAYDTIASFGRVVFYPQGSGVENTLKLWQTGRCGLETGIWNSLVKWTGEQMGWKVTRVADLAVRSRVVKKLISGHVQASHS